MGVPATLLRRWYVQGSLRNAPGGFTFVLKNRIAPTTITRVVEAHAMGRVYGADAIVLQKLNGQNTQPVPAHHITAKRPLPFNLNETIAVHVQGEPLPAGQHLITLEVETREVGLLRVPVEDVIAVPVLESATSSVA